MFNFENELTSFFIESSFETLARLDSFFVFSGLLDFRPFPLEGRDSFFGTDFLPSSVGVGEFSQISVSTTFLTWILVGIGVAERSIVMTLRSLPFMSKAFVGFWSLTCGEAGRVKNFWFVKIRTFSELLVNVFKGRSGIKIDEIRTTSIKKKPSGSTLAVPIKGRARYVISAP